MSGLSTWQFEPELIDANPYQPRLSEDEAHIQQLAESIREVGLLQTPLGRFVGDEANRRVQLAFGHSRLAAWKIARPGEARMLDVLVANYPNWVTRAQLGELSGFAAGGGTFSTYLNVLRRNGLAEVEGEHMRASETLFVE